MITNTWFKKHFRIIALHLQDSLEDKMGINFLKSQIKKAEAQKVKSVFFETLIRT